MGPGDRLVAILAGLRGYPEKPDTSVKALARVFGITASGQDADAEVLDALGELREQLIHVRSQLLDRGHTEAELAPIFKPLINFCITPNYLHQEWRQVRGVVLKAEIENGVRLVATILRGDEQAVAPERLAELASRLAELERTADAPGVTPWLRHLTKRHVRILRRGLRLYPISGVDALDTALDAVSGSVAKHMPDVAGEVAEENLAARAQWTNALRLYGDFADAAASAKPSESAESRANVRLRMSWNELLAPPALPQADRPPPLLPAPSDASPRAQDQNAAASQGESDER